MNITETLKKYENNLPRYIIIHGDNEWLRNYSKEQLIKTITENNNIYEIKTFNFESDMGEITNAISKTPFTEKNRLIVLNNSPIFSSKSKADESEILLNTKLAEGNILIVCTDGKIDRRKQAVKQIISLGISIECDIQKKEELKWLFEYIGNSNLNISQTNAAFAFEYCGRDIQDTINELHKINVICENKITQKDIEKYFAPSFQQNIFNMHNLLCDKKIKEGTEILINILREDSSPIGMLKLLFNIFKQMSDVHDYRKMGCNKDLTIQKIQSDWHISNNWQLENIYKSSFKLKDDKIKEGIRKLAEFDFGLKQGLYNAESDFISKITEIYT